MAGLSNQPMCIQNGTKNRLCLAFFLLVSSTCVIAQSELKAGQAGNPSQQPEAVQSPLSAYAEKRDAFIQHMVSTHKFEEQALKVLFQNLKPNEKILRTIAAPKENLHWYQYRKIFLTEARIKEGIKFWRENAKLLQDAEKTYGVPAAIIVAILGVETLYGQKTGNDQVLDALTTLAFAYPPRSGFFLKELEKFLIVCREEHINPLQARGSYAGAMGIPQFMPSSFLNFAVDFNQDGRRDIWHDTADAIGSVANYFLKFQWQTGQEVAVPLAMNGKKTRAALNPKLKIALREAKLESPQVEKLQPFLSNSGVKLLALKRKQGEELWAIYYNFHVITQYNRSPLYAMAVYQLSQAILNKKGAFP